MSGKVETKYKETYFKIVVYKQLPDTGLPLVHEQHLSIKQPEAKRHPPHSYKAEATLLKIPFPEVAVTRGKIGVNSIINYIHWPSKKKNHQKISGKSFFLYIVR